MKNYIFMPGWVCIIFLLALHDIGISQISKTFSFDTVVIGQFTLNNATVTYDKILQNNYIHSVNLGKPDLPIFSYTFYVPKGKKVSDIGFTPIKEEVITLKNNLFPVQRPVKIGCSLPDSLIVGPDSTVYSSNSAYPVSNAMIYNNSYYDHDLQLVTVQICPFQYYPATNKLICFRSVNISINETSMPVANILTSKQHDQSRISFLNSIIQNPQDLSTDISTLNIASSQVQSDTKILNESSAQVTYTPPNWTSWTKVKFYQYTVVMS